MFGAESSLGGEEKHPAQREEGCNWSGCRGKTPRPNGKKVVIGRGAEEELPTQMRKKL